MANGKPGRSAKDVLEVESRVARLEEGLEGVRGEVHGLAVSIRDLSDKISRRSETNWGVYFSGLGVLLAFVLSVGGGALAPLYLMTNNNSTQLASAVTALSERIDDKIDSVNKIRENELEAMDEVLQREMRLLNDAQDTDVSHLEQQLSLLRTSHAKVSEQLRAHEQLEGHPTAMAMHTATTQSFDKLNTMFSESLRDLDIKLQREMELADQSQIERLNALDEKLQMEIRSLKELMRSEVSRENDN